jgi:hypothetical protein
MKWKYKNMRTGEHENRRTGEQENRRTCSDWREAYAINIAAEDMERTLLPPCLHEHTTCITWHRPYAM